MIQKPQKMLVGVDIPGCFAVLRKPRAAGWEKEVALKRIEEQLEGERSTRATILKRERAKTSELARLKEQLEDAHDVLRRLRQWDVLNLEPGLGDDGPYWRGQIDRALSYPASEPEMS